jgi:hypothetical protein
MNFINLYYNMHFVIFFCHHLAIGYSGYLRGPVNLWDPCFFDMCITPVAGLQYAKSRLTGLNPSNIYERASSCNLDFFSFFLSSSLRYSLIKDRQLQQNCLRLSQ